MCALLTAEGSLSLERTTEGLDGPQPRDKCKIMRLIFCAVPDQNLHEVSKKIFDVGLKL